MQRSVRILGEAAGMRLEEISASGRNALCCGWGGQVYPSHSSYAARIATARASESESDYLTYCSNCRDIFASCGKRAVHILDVLFGADRANESGKPFADGETDVETDAFAETDVARRLPSLSQRRENRRRLKETLLTKYWTGSPKERAPASPALTLRMNKELVAQMNRDLIREEEVYRIVAHCEETGEYIRHANDGSVSGCLTLGHVTVWVRYRKSDDGFELMNVYSHRLQFEKT
jgi:hypothetical protein